jgi:hypothetical protein
LTAIGAGAVELRIMTGEGGMGELVNLNRFRKAQEKSDQLRKAEANRQSHGRTKLQKEREATERQRLDLDLDGKKLT